MSEPQPRHLLELRFFQMILDGSPLLRAQAISPFIGKENMIEVNTLREDLVNLSVRGVSRHLGHRGENPGQLDHQDKTKNNIFLNGVYVFST